MAVIALFQSPPLARDGSQAHDERMDRGRATRSGIWGAMFVALCVFFGALPAHAEPGDDVPPAAQGPTPAAGAPAPAPEPTASDTDPRALTDFEPQLAPYGAWVNDEKYGRVWVPDRSIVGEGFSPYGTGGHWGLDTDENWVWVSDYAFGDVVFHYGRWTWTTYGWSWVPGYQYAPAWVEWRVPTAEYDYVGWAPAPPYYYWQDGLAVSLWYAPPYYWVFCPSARVFAPYPYRYFVTRPAYVRSVARYTTRYEGGGGRGAFGGPPLRTARVSATAAPSARVAIGPTRGSSIASARAASGVSVGARGAFSSQSRAFSTSPALSRPSVASSSRVWSEPSRSVAPSARAFSPPARSAPPSVYAPSRPAMTGARAYAPATYSSPRVYSPPSRVYSPPARSYSPASSPMRVYSPPARSYSPPARSYSAPRVSSPARVYSSPAWHSSPSFSHGSSSHRR